MCHVLIIEDELLIAMQIEDVLLESGADTVAIAATEAEAVSSARAKLPDVVFSDVRLLEGTGPAAVAAIRKMSSRVSVTFVTAWPDACSEFRAFAEVLVKPVSAPMIRSSFQRALLASC